uniref:Uncharacterized protein n=1 Tax=Eutreptiella gymnastica TaxID=73025 RepID=A0A7S4G5V1_9EUGL
MGRTQCKGPRMSRISRRLSYRTGAGLAAAQSAAASPEQHNDRAQWSCSGGLTGASRVRLPLHSDAFKKTCGRPVFMARGITDFYVCYAFRTGLLRTALLLELWICVSCVPRVV